MSFQKYFGLKKQPVAQVGKLCLAVLFGFLSVSCAKRTEPEALPWLDAVTAITHDVPLYIDSFGNCATIASITIQPQVTGILAQTLYKEGDHVTAGQKLYEIDPEPYKAALEQAQGDLQAAQADLWNSQQNLQRQSQLYSKATIDLQTLQNAQAAEHGYEGKLQAAEAALKQATINLGYCSITAPITGKAGVYMLNSGNLATANTSKLVNIQMIQPIYVEFTVPETEFHKIHEYFYKNKETLKVIITVPGKPEYETYGELEFLDNTISTQTGTLKLRALCQNQDSALWPGLFVNVRLILYTLSSAVLVPQSAILVGQNGPFLFVIDATGYAHLRTVTTGGGHGDWVVVTEGVKVGEIVVTAGQLMLTEGSQTRVRLKPVEFVQDTAADSGGSKK